MPMRSRSALPFDRLTSGKRAARRSSAGSASRVAFDLVARAVEFGERLLDLRLAIAVRHQRRAQAQQPLRREVMRKIGIGRGDLVAQRAHRRDRILGGDRRTMRAQPRVESLLGAQHDRFDRPERVVQVECDRADAHDRSAQLPGVPSGLAAAFSNWTRAARSLASCVAGAFGAVRIW